MRCANLGPSPSWSGRCFPGARALWIEKHNIRTRYKEGSEALLIQEVIAQEFAAHRQRPNVRTPMSVSQGGPGRAQPMDGAARSQVASTLDERIDECWPGSGGANRSWSDAPEVLMAVGVSNDRSSSPPA